MDISELEAMLMKCWCKETSSDPRNWTADNPAWGQCAVTSLIVNDALGGEIVWGEAHLPDGRKILHYFNLVDKREIDLTRRQFPAGTLIPEGVPKTQEFKTTRAYMLSYPETVRRYVLLKERILQD